MSKALRNLTFIGVGTVLGLFGAQFFPSYAKGEKAPPKIVVDDTPVQRDQKFTSSFAPVIKKAAPSVVNIFATRILKQRDMRGMHPFFFDPRFRELPDDEDPPMRRQKAEALGSGVIVSDDGYILTCNHVIEGADEIKVEINGGKEYTAKVIGADPDTDTAVLKVNATGLPAITLASSDKLEVGDVVLAIGNPFGIGQTVTMGIVSATGRGELGIMAYEDFIQTDASINMGNSGGALVDAQGRLIGVNSAIMSRTGGNQGVGFAIPVNMARMVMERLISDGKVTRGYLGVNLEPNFTSELAARLKLKENAGALVTEVVEGTPAAEAGIRHGDVIVEYNGKKVNDMRQLRLMVSQTKPNTKVAFKVIRDGKTKNFSLTLAELPTERTLSGFLRRGGEPTAPDQEETLEGVEVSDLDGRGRRQFSIPGHVRGALVTNVDPNSTAFEKGLRPGDVILEIEQKAVTNADEAVTLSQEFKGNQVLLRVWSRGSTKYVLVDVNRNREPETKEQDRDK